MKHIFIINPISGHGSTKKIVPLIQEYCQKEKLAYELIYSEYAGHSIAIAKRYFANDDVCLYAVGGDGTANEVLNGLNDKVPMAIIPSGSGNDYFGSFYEEMPPIAEIIEKTIGGEFMAVDYGIANNFRFLNIVSVGFCGDINYKANTKYKNIKLIPSKVVYIVTALASMFKPIRLKLHFKVDEVQYSRDCLILAVCSGIRYGGGFKPVPFAKLNDGKFNICLIDYVKTATIAKVMPLYFKGEHTKLDIAHFYEGSEIVINGEYPMYFNVDGEVMLEKDMKISLLPLALTIRVPQEVKERLEC